MLDSEKAFDLVCIEESEFGVINNIVYATQNNPVGFQIYHSPNCYLHRDAANLAQRCGCIIKIYDAFRPAKAHRVLWKAYKHDTNFVSDPDVDNHCRGVAVDITLVNPLTNKELDMGSDVYTVSKKSSLSSNDFESYISKNREILVGIMSQFDFCVDKDKWWNFQLSHFNRYPVISSEAEKLLGGIIESKDLVNADKDLSNALVSPTVEETVMYCEK